jgi:membrane protease YdiL (CAAX protease family)
LVAYFALAYAITWGGIFVVVASRGFDLLGFTAAAVALVALPMLLGPGIAGLVLTALYGGSPALADLGARLRRWRVPTGMWVIALGTNPITFLAVLGVLTIVVSPDFAPVFNPAFLVLGLVAGALEELGWTGFATPRLLGRMPVLRAGLVLGVLWAAWHAAADFTINGAAMGPSWIPYFTVYWLGILVPYRVLMTWVYARTGSVLVAICMHASYTGWQGALAPATEQPQTFVWQLALAIALGIVVVAIVRPWSVAARQPVALEIGVAR